MKKAITLLLAAAVLCALLTACGQPNEFEQKTLVLVEYRVIQCFTGNLYYDAVDLEAGTYSTWTVIRIPEESAGQSQPAVKALFTAEQAEKFRRDAVSHGICRLKDVYHAEGIYDGDGWDLRLVFSDGSEKCTDGYMKTPREFKKLRADFKALCGYEIV